MTTASQDKVNHMCFLLSARSLLIFGFGGGPSLRTHHETVRLAYEYLRLTNRKEREVFFKKFGVRWSEFVRLPYFDMIRMRVIDPMHNLLLGM